MGGSKWQCALSARPTMREQGAVFRVLVAGAGALTLLFLGHSPVQRPPSLRNSSHLALFPNQNGLLPSRFHAPPIPHPPPPPPPGGTISLFLYSTYSSLGVRGKLPSGGGGGLRGLDLWVCVGVFPGGGTPTPMAPPGPPPDTPPPPLPPADMTLPPPPPRTPRRRQDTIAHLIKTEITTLAHRAPHPCTMMAAFTPTTALRLGCILIMTIGSAPAEVSPPPNLGAFLSPQPLNGQPLNPQHPASPRFCNLL